MNLLGASLERFNRKERNLLVREMLGGATVIPELAESFREPLANAVGLKARDLEHAWWATDFHFDWLAGALLHFMKGGHAGWEPNRAGTLQSRSGNSLQLGLVMGSQEDVDVVMAAHVPGSERPYHLILIEAKAYGCFATEQYERKVKRLELLHEFYEELERGSPHKISFHYVLCSRKKPGKLAPKRLRWQASGTLEPQHLHIELALPESFTRVATDTARSARRDKVPSKWKCVTKGPEGGSARGAR